MEGVVAVGVAVILDPTGWCKQRQLKQIYVEVRAMLVNSGE